MAFTQAQLDAVETAIASGELTIRGADGRTVTYRSMSELMSARDTIRDSLKASGALPAVTRTSYASRERA